MAFVIMEKTAFHILTGSQQRNLVLKILNKLYHKKASNSFIISDLVIK